jgi:hypothetical protein
MGIGKITGLVTSLVIFAASAGLYVYRQDVLDWLVLRDYEPSPAIARLASNASLSDEGRKLFYVHDPALLDKSTFQGSCGASEETIVLGCYITHQKIYVFDVEDERLQGVEEVTAAHEMLHAAFDRLSDNEKERITSLLQDTFTSLNDERLNKTIATYEKRDPSIVPNELHSIIGTEVRELPQELESYYEQYFLDRLAVVGKAEAYEAEFTKLEDQIELYDQQLNSLKRSIEESQVNIDQLGAALNLEKQQLEAKRGNPEAYNAAIPAYNQKVREYNALIQRARDLVSQFNQLVEERNLIALEERELIDAIDTRATEL